MQSLLKKRKNQRATETLIKESLLCQLSFTVKEVQLLHSQTNEIFSSNEACNSLIVVLEAIFLHGLKKGILQTALKTVGGIEETKPQPSFWSTVSNYTHKNMIATIKNLSQITTDVGRCRVWLRIALNQMELTSYFQAMEKERRSIHSNYYNYSFLRDRETCDTACKLLEGIVAVRFEIPINSSILNTWSNEPLMLSGIWSPPMKTPVSTAIDVAEGIEDDFDDDDTASIKTSSSITTLSTILALDENQALKMILDTPIRKLEKEINAVPIVERQRPTTLQLQLQPQPSTSVTESIFEEDEKEEDNIVSCENDHIEVSIGNSITSTSGWSSTDAEDLKPASSIKIEEPKTFTGLLESYSSPPKNTTDYQKMFFESKEKEIEEESEDTSEYEILSNSVSNEYDNKLFKIQRENSLKNQKYICANCQLSIGLNFAEARLCYFTGDYFCSNCHFNETSVIPSRVIFNWDFKKYPVSSKASSYLNEISHKPIVDIKQTNPKLYSVVQEMKELRTKRLQLSMLRAYLYTCREPVIVELQKKVWPREYIYEHIHLYSLNDLYKIPNGILASELNSVITYARDHVVGCWLCSQKGFICEVCKNPKVIYPFDCSTTYRCSKCHSVYHEGCLMSSKNCRKCKRKEERTTSPDDDSLGLDDSVS